MCKYPSLYVGPVGYKLCILFAELLLYGLVGGGGWMAAPFGGGPVTVPTATVLKEDP